MPIEPIETDTERILKTLLYSGIFALLVGLLVVLTGCGGAVPLPDVTLTPCQQAKVARVLICQQDPAGDQCRRAEADEGRACQAPDPTPDPDPEPEPEPDPSPVCKVGETCGCWHRPPPGPWVKFPDCPTPDPDPLPEPLPEPEWRTANGTEECPRGAQGKYRLEVQQAARAAFDEGTIVSPWTKGEKALYNALIPYLIPHRLKGAFFYEEFAVQRGEGFSENYDLLRADGSLMLSGDGLYKSTCTPALRTEELPVKSTAWPQLPVSTVRIKVHVPATARPDGRAVLDGVALHCGAKVPEFGDRLCYPAGGPEGTKERDAIDRGLLKPTWFGGEEHPSNPWLYFARPGATVTACVLGVCSDPVVW